MRFSNELFSGRKSRSHHLLLSILSNPLLQTLQSIPQSQSRYSTRNTRNNSLYGKQHVTNPHLPRYWLGGGECGCTLLMRYSPGTLVKTSVVLQFFPVHPDLYSDSQYPPEIPPGTTGIIISQSNNGFIQWLVGEKIGWSNSSYIYPLQKVHQ